MTPHRPPPDGWPHRSPEPKRIRDLKLPGSVPDSGLSARDADLELLSRAPGDYLDTTHFDTVRFPPPPWAQERFAQAARDGSLAYTGYRGHAAVLESVAGAIGEFMACPLDPGQNLILTPGTQAGLFAALSSCVEAGDRVALLDPDYLFSARILRFLGAEIGYVPLCRTVEGYVPDLEALEREFAQLGARQLVFSHPNNPTGAVYPSSVLQAIAGLAGKYDVQVVVDELYARLLYGDTRYTHLAALPGMFEHSVTLLGPSKTESLSGYRLGVVVGPAQIMARVENVLSIMALRAPAYAQHVLLPWLRDDAGWLQTRLRDFEALRGMTLRRLRELPWLELVQGDATAYAWPDLSALDMPDATVATALLEKARVLVSPGYQFGPSGKGHFRVCFARDEAEWGLALERMVGVLDELAGPKGLPGRVLS